MSQQRGRPQLMGRYIRNNVGEIEVDPTCQKDQYLRWRYSLETEQGINYRTLRKVSPKSSELITRYVLDMADGKNIAKGTHRGPRAFNHLNSMRLRLERTVQILEDESKKELIHLTEDDVLRVFNAMRDGRILSANKLPFLSTQTYTKKFAAFWRWYMRIEKKNGNVIEDIVSCLDTSMHEKPKWHHFTLKDVEKMGDIASSVYYKALTLFLFDSGIRAPTELMNVRACDISEIPNTNLLQVQIREETSKTFGRKIKLMLSSAIMKKFIEISGKKGQEFLFDHSYHVMTRRVARLGFEVMKIGQTWKQKNSKVLVKKGISMYDFRHNSVCHYLPIYKSENQMKYRYGWKKADMIHYYSEFIGMSDTIRDEDMLIDTSKTELQQRLEKEQNRVTILEDQLKAKELEMDQRVKKLEAMMLQKFADNY